MKETTVVNNLKQFRKQGKKLTQQEMADIVGVSRQSINAIEKGKFLPSITTALRIAEYFNVPVEEIFYLEDDKSV
ncbi:helix-turn-helix transcriptional regulator [Erysipelothrix sp. HDW6C]|uniref:helix-turn-helix transcriptional regulator n=1 Tax=Erysipelothrix sp. HDW6C TaxID=2714930 RepID=UPI001409046A|nr:helix-turn-helix transcriptional regulator [Erysipelothrix sp. HDW6C]QIK70695.1 helix-turn-helix transcriptional regulator [Erysipelothrix sp. HDW6C]